jgi:hypothetical protein
VRLRAFKARKARIHLHNGDTFEGIWTGLRAGHYSFESCYHLLEHEGRPERVLLDGRTDIPERNVLCVQVLYV